MKLKESCKIAFAMYSAIPTPYADWSKENMKYAVCFFPAVGIACGALLCLWGWLAGLLQIGGVLFAAVCVLIPFLVTGGIHMDGFCDTSDALASHQTRERKLEILKDSHTGAFGVMSCGLYLILNLGLWCELTPDWRTLGVLAVGYLVSRSLSGLSIVSFRCAKNSGLLATFSDGAQKKNVRVVMAVYLLLCGGAMVWIQPLTGALALLGALAAFGYYRLMSYRQFGGTTGDLAGHFLQLCELLMLACAVLAQKL